MGRISYAVLLWGLVGLTAAGQLLDQRGVGIWEVPVTGFSTVRLEGPGDWEIIGASGSHLVLEALDPQGRRTSLSRQNLHVRRAQRHLVISFRASGTTPLAARFRVSVPTSVEQVQVTSLGGGAQLRGLRSARVRAVGGPISVHRVESDVEVEIGGGQVRMDEIGGSVRCRSGGGQVEIRQVARDVWLEFAGGNARVEDVGGKVELLCGGGDVAVARVRGGVRAETVRTTLRVEQVAGEVNVQATQGALWMDSVGPVRCVAQHASARIRGVRGTLWAATQGGPLIVDLDGGQLPADWSLKAVLGDVTLWIPSYLSAEVEAVSFPVGERWGIWSDFPALRARLGGQATEGLVPLVATGRLGRGGALLQVTSTGGRVWLRRK